MNLAAIRERLPSAAAAIALQVGLFALLALSFEAVRHVGEEKETILILPPLAQPKLRPPMMIDARGKARPRPAPDATTVPAPFVAIPPTPGDTAQNAPLAGASGRGGGGGGDDRCTPEKYARMAPSQRTACPPPPSLDQPGDLPLYPHSDVKDPERWKAEVERKNAPVGLPGASGGWIGLLGTLLFNPGAYGDKRNYSYAPPSQTPPTDGAEMTRQYALHGPACPSTVMDDSTRKVCEANTAAAPLLHFGGSVAVQGPHASDTAFAQALAATQARTRSLYGKPVLASAPKSGDGNEKTGVSGGPSGADTGSTNPGR